MSRLLDPDVNGPLIGVPMRVYSYDSNPGITITDTSSPYQLVEAGYEYDLELEYDAMVSILGMAGAGYAVAESALALLYAEIYDATNAAQLKQSRATMRHDASTASLRLRWYSIPCMVDVAQAAGTTVTYQFLVGSNVASKLTSENMAWWIDVRRV